MVWAPIVAKKSTFLQRLIRHGFTNGLDINVMLFFIFLIIV